MIVSTEQWRDSAIPTHVSISPKFPSHPGSHIMLTELRLPYSRSLLVIHLKYSSVHVHCKLPHCPFPSFSPHPTPQPQICSLRLWVFFFCFVNKFICIMLYFTYKGCWVSLVAQTVNNLPAKQETWVQSWVGKIPWERVWQSTPVLLPGKSHGQRSLEGYSP